MQIDNHHQLESLDLNSGCFLLIDKPKGWTSFDVVKYVRDNYPGYVNKIGHAGTLDPMATGLLILCTGKMTKSIEDFQLLPKTYEVTFRLGYTTPSFDAESEFDGQFRTEHLNEQVIQEGIEALIGEFQQTPPAYSAAKVNGSRAHKEARKGKEVTPNPKPVTVYSFDLLRVNWPDIHCRIQCSKGTYIRSLARDLGLYLESGAYVTELRRTAIGHYYAEDALSLSGIDALFQQIKTPS